MGRLFRMKWPWLIGCFLDLLLPLSDFQDCFLKVRRRPLPLPLDLGSKFGPQKSPLPSSQRAFKRASADGALDHFSLTPEDSLGPTQIR